MWLVAVRKTIMQLECNISFVFTPILMKHVLVLPNKAYSKLALKVRKNDGLVCWQRGGLIID